MGGFSTGYTPTFGVIGNGNVVYYDDAGYNETAVMGAIQEAIASFNPNTVIVANPVANFELNFSATSDIDVSNVFSVESGDPITVTVEGSSNPTVATATISGNTVTVIAGTTVGVATITIKGTAGDNFATDAFDVSVKDPNSNIIIEEGFEGGALPDGWLSVDADGDTYKWNISPAGMANHTGDFCFQSASYDNTAGALTPDNWLITPQFNLGGEGYINYWVCAQDAAWAGEHYGIYISTTGTAPADFTLLFEETMTAKEGKAAGTYYEKNVSLADYNGDVYVAIRHFNCTDMFFLNIDDITIADAGAITNSNNVAKNCELFQNYPNPFNPTTSIAFNLALNSDVKLSVFNAKGEIIANLVNGSLNKGLHKVNFDASSLNSGVYYYTIEANGSKLTKKMLLVK